MFILNYLTFPFVIINYITFTFVIKPGWVATEEHLKMDGLKNVRKSAHLEL